jgi:carboxyl-terminal processing protease
MKKSLIMMLLSVPVFLLGPVCPVFSDPGGDTVENIEEKEDIEKEVRIFADAFVLVKENYVDEITANKLVYGALKGMIGALDPYSQFMEPDVAELVKSDTEGEFGGLGIRITTKNSYITVITPLPDTPAFKAGILPGDMIAKIEGEDAKGIKMRDAVKKLRGPKGTEVTISIYREGEEDLLEFNITRDIIVPKKVYSRMEDSNIGYVRLVEFTDDAPEKLSNAITELKKEGAESLILDLRNNPGGLLKAAVEISGFFIDKGEMIVYTKGRSADQNREFHASGDPLDSAIPLCVLINKGSASGSEIVAGCIKDHNRGIILGEKSFGKASVQSIIDLEDESALRLTTAKYYTPAGNLIHEKGIQPHIEVSLTREERRKIIEGQQVIYNPNKTDDNSADDAEPDYEAPDKGSDPVADSEKTEEKAPPRSPDLQLERAKDLLKARKIFMSYGKSDSGDDKLVPDKTEEK